MKNLILFSLLFVLSGLFMEASAQQESISKAMGVIVFPNEDQDVEKQEYDEFKCYKWSVEYTGFDPASAFSNQSQAKPGGGNTGGKVIKGAAGGALFGALIGAVSGDAGKGAKIGAAVGGGGALLQGASSEAAAKKRFEELKKKNEAEFTNFKKAFCLCLDSKGYKAAY